MSASLAVEEVVAILRRRFGKPSQFGRSQRLWAFGTSLTCSVNYSKLLQGHHFFFGLSGEVVDEKFTYTKTRFGDFVLLVCGSSEKVLCLPRSLVLEMLDGVTTQRLDVFIDGNAYILQTTRHPKLDVTEFLNAYPKAESNAEASEHEEPSVAPDRDHVRIQSSLIDLGWAHGCSVWVPPSDRGLSYKGRSFSERTIARLPNFGFDENTRRIVQNIDVLWLSKNVILKAFEVEATTSIYSGLLRLNDLNLVQPNSRIEVYIVATASRRLKVFNQLIRPSFQALLTTCEFLTFEEIENAHRRIEGIPIAKGARVTGLLRGERFTHPERYVYPSGI